MRNSPAVSELPLQGAHKADIAIVGAGFTGLWTALFLSELSPGTNIAIVEKTFAGYGASGRNAGILAETVDHSHSLAIAHFGLEEARKLAKIGLQNIDEMASFFAAEKIDCNFERTGRLYVALTQAHAEEAKSSIAVAEQVGVSNMQFLDRAQIQDEIHSPLYLAGAFAPGGGILDPVKLIQGLKRVCQQRRIRIFENSAVQTFGSDAIRTPAGSLSADRVIVATDAYTHQLLPKLVRRFLPLYDYILVSEPLTEEQSQAIGWKNKQGVTDGRTFFNYYRLTSDHRILWGTSEAKYYSPNGVSRNYDHSEEQYRSLEESFCRHFPQLSTLKFPYRWGGPIASTTRLTPFFGELQKGKILYALGYTGHGIGSTRIAGKILAHLSLQRPSELLELRMVRNKPFPYPPEPFRSIAVRAVTRSLRAVDRGEKPGLLLRMLDRFGIGFSS